MNSIIEAFEDLNILNNERLKNYTLKTDLETLIIFATYIRNKISDEFISKNYSPFSFVPAGEISGAGGCSEISCRIRRAKNYSLFCGLYSDNVYLILEYLTSIHFEYNFEAIKEEDEFNYRYAILLDFSIISTYADLISCGIVQILPPEQCICKDCFQRELLKLSNPVNLTPLINYYENTVKLKIYDYQKYNKEITIFFENMDDFFPLHGETLTFTGNTFKYFSKLECKKGLEIKNEECKHEIIKQLIEGEFSRACQYSLHCRENDSKFITSKPSDSIFFELTRDKNIKGNSIPNVDNLPIYEMPIVSSASIKTILNLREVENDAFDRYRIALNRVIVERHNADNEIQMKEIYDDILYPEMIHLDEQLHNIKSGAYKKAFSSIIISSILIATGVYTGAIPHNAPEILSSLGGVSAITRGIEEVFKPSSSIKDNDYYFLWRLKKKI